MQGFDKCLGGGLQNKSFNLIYGPPGTGKTSFCFSLIKSLLENHYTVVFVNIDEEITELKNRYSSYKISFIQNEKNRRLIFIDAFSAMAELPKSPDPYAILAKPYAENLNFNIIKAIKDTTKHRFVFIDSISSMLIHDDISLVQKSLRQLYLKSKVMNLHVFLIIIHGMHSRETLVTVKYMADNVFYTDFENDHFIMKIEKTRGIKPVKKTLRLEVTDTAVILT